ncbi:glycosyltransferase family A protein [Treponema saccharophilum]|uniref:Glycosyl transferase family 2 n=1 Tax=Treponema saccharophilum DSM 2985 TaxID=907348 RepID=H7EI40_9SPIR|nr:glycosyltransferase family A protein [Treponema saccharophilum]EIC02719.1 glycosyl transferase family 2 [Treponema saccharophilum DSM 2985]BDC96127.1 hypothetical protein TRSA_12260 [Treponema saccharophilum]
MSDRDEIKFSVVMPTYNREFCICNAIASVVAQTYQNFELIIVDDGSTDNTETLIQDRYKEFFKSKKFVYIKQKNSGVCAARNTGLSLAKNDWIAYLDSDNTLPPFFLETFKTEIEKNPDYSIFYSQMKRNTGAVIGQELDYGHLIKGNLIDLGTFVHKRALCEKYGLFDTKLKRLVDWDFILRYTRYEKSYFISKVLLNYVDGDFTRITNSENFVLAEQGIKKKLSHLFYPFYNKICGNDFIQVFFDTGNGFSEFETAIFSTFPIELKSRENLESLRIDPSARHCIVKDISIKSENTDLSFTTNAYMQKNNAYFFNTTDPQIYVDISGHEKSNFFFNMKVFALDETCSAAIAEQNATIAEQNATIAEQNATIAEQNATIAEQNATIAEQNATIAEQNSTIAEQNATIAEQNSTIAEQNATIAEQNSTIAEQNSTIAEQSATIANLRANATDLQCQLEEQIWQSDLAIQAKQREINSIYASHSWRITKPLRFVTRILRKVLRK